MVQIEDEAERTALQAQAAKEGWSTDQLLQKVRPLVVDKPTPGAKRRKGGRKFQKPKSTQDALRRLVELSRQWLKYYKDIGADTGQSILVKLAEATPGEHDAKFLEQLREAKDVMKKVERAARKAAGRLQEAESKAEPHQSVVPKGPLDRPAKSEKGKKSRPAR